MKKWLIGILGLIVILPLLLLVFRKDNVISLEKAIEYCESPQSNFYTWEGLQIHYTEQGYGDTTILMIHGFGGSHKNFTLAAEQLKADYRVVCVDLPAFGLSEVPSGDYEDDELFALYQNFIRNSIEVLNIEYYHLMGNSMGGWIAWDLAAEDDSTLLSLTLLNSAGFGMEKVKETATGWMTTPFGDFIFKKGVPYRMSKSNAARCFSDDSKVNLDRVKEHYYMLNKEGTFPWMLRMAGGEVLPDTALLESIACPSLIVWGDEDEIVPVDHAEKFAKRIPNNQLIIYKKCGHTPQMEFPNKFVDDWKNFVTNLDEI